MEENCEGQCPEDEKKADIILNRLNSIVERLNNINHLLREKGDLILGSEPSETESGKQSEENNTFIYQCGSRLSDVESLVSSAEHLTKRLNEFI